MERCQGVASIALTLGCSLLPGGWVLADIVTTALELMLIRRTDWGTTVSVTMLMKNIQIFLDRFTMKISESESDICNIIPETGAVVGFSSSACSFEQANNVSVTVFVMRDLQENFFGMNSFI